VAPQNCVERSGRHAALHWDQTDARGQHADHGRLRGGFRHARTECRGQGGGERCGAAAGGQGEAHRIFFYSLFDSSNFGIVFFVFLASAVYYWRTIQRAKLLLPLLLLLAVAAEVYINASWYTPAIRWTNPRFTVR